MSQIGSSLRAARQDLGASIADVSRETRIPAYHIEAIEHEDFGALPAPVYVRGFIRNYAKAVGLEPEALVGQLDAEWREPPSPTPRHHAPFTLATANFGGVARPASDGWGGIRRERAAPFPDDHFEADNRRAGDAPGVLTASPAGGRGFALPQVHLPRLRLPSLPALPALRFPRLPAVPRPSVPAVKLPGRPSLPTITLPAMKAPAMPSLPAVALPSAPSRRTTLYIAAGALAVGVFAVTGLLVRGGLTGDSSAGDDNGEPGALVAADTSTATATPTATATATPTPTLTPTPPPTAIPTPTPVPVPPPPAIPASSFAYCTSLGGGNYSCGDQPWRVICAPGGYFFDPQGIVPRPIPAEWAGWSETTLTGRLELIHGVC